MMLDFKLDDLIVRDELPCRCLRTIVGEQSVMPIPARRHCWNRMVFVLGVNRRNSAYRRTSHPATTVIELTIAVAILGVLLASSVRMLYVMKNQQTAADRRIVALQTLQAVSEQVGNIPWEQLTTEAANQVRIPLAAASYLPDAKLITTVDEETDPVSKRIVVQLVWRGAGNQKPEPVQLTSWAFSNRPQVDSTQP